MGTLTDLDEAFPPEFLVTVAAKDTVGAGFFVTVEGHVATCRHIVRDRQGGIASTVSVRCRDGQPVAYSPLGEDADEDLIVLAPTAGTGLPRVPAALLRDPTAARTRDGYRIWGFADDRTTVAGALPLTLSTAFSEYGRIGVVGPIKPGDSGGPMLFARTRIAVGLAQSASKLEGRGGVIPAILLVRLLDRLGLNAFVCDETGRGGWTRPEQAGTDEHRRLSGAPSSPDPTGFRATRLCSLVRQREALSAQYEAEAAQLPLTADGGERVRRGQVLSAMERELEALERRIAEAGG